MYPKVFLFVKGKYRVIHNGCKKLEEIAILSKKCSMNIYMVLLQMWLNFYLEIYTNNIMVILDGSLGSRLFRQEENEEEEDIQTFNNCV